MRKYIFFILIIFIGCTSKKTSDNENINKDTLIINNTVFLLDSANIEEFKSLHNQNVDYYNTEKIDDTINVSRDSSKLTFHLRNGADSILVNDTTEDWGNFVNYNYIKSYKNIDYWLIEAIFYEGRLYLLLDKENGNKIWIWGAPIFSPNNKYFITNSCDLQAAYDPNGFQLFEIKNNKVIKSWEKEINDWGPDEIKWKDERTILIKKLKYDTNNKELYSYKSMKIN